jgi:prevent-host-death family protein
MTIRFSEPVGHRRVKNELPAVLRETVERGLVVPITNRGEVDAYLVPPEAREELERAERLRAAIPLLMAAAAAGAAVPSQTLRELGIEIPFDWRALNRFTARASVTFTEGEDGEPWVVAPAALPEPVLEDDTELDL